jgi:hypothetical protein
MSLEVFVITSQATKKRNSLNPHFFERAVDSTPLSRGRYCRMSIKRPISVPLSSLTAVECYTCREVSKNYSESLLFHGGNMCSNPVRDANLPQHSWPHYYFNNFTRTLRFSGSPAQLNKEASSWRVRCKRLGVPVNHLMMCYPDLLSLQTLLTLKNSCFLRARHQATSFIVSDCIGEFFTFSLRRIFASIFANTR